MSVGQTMADNRITVALVDRAVLAALPIEKAPPGVTPVSKHIEMLHLLGHRVLVEKESLDRFPHTQAVPAMLPGAEVASEADIAAAMARADAVICY